MHKAHEKSTLRSKCLSNRKTLTSEYRKNADVKIRNLLAGMAEIKDEKNLAAFISDGFEPDLCPLLNECLHSGKKIFLPRSTGGMNDYEMTEINDLTTELVQGRYGIMEPASGLPAVEMLPTQQIVWLIPFVGYDEHGTRLGRGKGVYDRLLKNSGGIRIGVGYQCQRIPVIPAEIHDCPLDIVVTESGIVRFNKH
jgi:5-formyltetrahydrofolate cyclo-ligase